MHRRIHLKKKIKLLKSKNYGNKKSKKNFLLIILIAVMITIYISFKLINDKFSPLYMQYAVVEAKKVAHLIINNSVTDEINKQLTIDNLLIVDKNSNNQVMTIDFNPTFVNKILKQITKNIQSDFSKIEQGKVNNIDWLNNSSLSYDINDLKKGIIYKIPTGIVLNNVLLHNLGPKIPVKMDITGEIITNIKTNVTNYGINNALIEVYVTVSITQKVLLPITTKEIKITSDIPLAIKMIQGTVPEYYYGGINKNSSSFSLPTE